MWDPLRRKEVAETPEERVRQWFIGVLSSNSFPMGLMGSEVALSFGGKSLRADIVVYDRSGAPLAIVECKRPEVEISADVARQALLYHGALQCAIFSLRTEIIPIFTNATDRSSRL